MSLLSITRLSKTYGGVVALRDATLTVEAGEAHALIGENGAGKSTLIRILAGAVEADSGEITLDERPVSISSAREAHRLGLRFVHQELHALAGMSVAENLFLGRAYPTRLGGLIDWRALHDRSRAALAALGVSDIAPDTVLGRLPVGDRMIVKIAATFLEDASAPGRLFVMDEPTAALTSTEVERLFRIIGELKRLGRAIIYVSHRIDEVLRICDRVTVMRDGVSGPPILTAAATRELMIERMTGRPGLEAAATARSPARPGVALSVERLTGEGFADVSFDLREGEILGLAALGEAGADRLIKGLIGAARGGAFWIAGRRARIRNPADAWRQGIAYVPRERRSEGLFLSQDVACNFALPHLKRLARLVAFVNRPAELAEAGSVGKRVRLRAASLKQSVWRLSGGNQQKAMFARAVAGAPRILLLDEPTRGVDIAAKFEIHALIGELAEAGAAILVSSSDHEELIALSSRIAILAHGRISRFVPPDRLTPQRLLAMCYGERPEPD